MAKLVSEEEVRACYLQESRADAGPQGEFMVRRVVEHAIALVRKRLAERLRLSREEGRWTDEECLELLRPFASGAAMMSPDIMFSPKGLYALIRAAVAEARREQAEKDARIAEKLGCLPREVNVLGSTKRVLGCGSEVAFGIRQEAAILSQKKPEHGE